MTAVTDAGPLIVLAKINHLHLLLSLFGNVIVPPAVYHETVVVGLQRGYADAEVLQTFLNGVGWHSVAPADMPRELASEPRLGRGECEAIALALQHQRLLLIDDVHARSVADDLGIRTVGTVGILVEAYRKDKLTAEVLDELLIVVESRKDIWVHPEICRRARREVLKR
jgi:predicted nucleic acid-binding protein